MDSTIGPDGLPASESSNADLSHATLVDKIFEEPDNVELLNEVSRRILDEDQAPDLYEAFAERHRRKELPYLPLPYVDPHTWANCNDSQWCRPKEIRDVTSCKDLVDAVTYARDKKWAVRAVGSGHSFSAVAVTDDLLLRPQQMKQPLEVEKSSLRDETIASNLVSVESGMEIKTLNSYLDGIGKALPTLGAYDGQTVAGAISTGTHGSMHRLGPLASLVRSLVLVSETGTVYQVEPSNGITDPAKFVPGELNKVLKQDDDWFQSVLVAMGCLGLIYSYTLEVRGAFKLCENRTLTTWQELKPQLQNGLDSDLFKYNDYFEIDINPYPTFPWEKSLPAIQITRNELPSEVPALGTRGFGTWLAGLLAKSKMADYVLVSQLNNLPKLTPPIVTMALRSLQDKNFVRSSSEVFILDTVNYVKAYAMELSFDCSGDFTKIVDDVIAAFQQAARDKNWFIAGPIALRFVSQASALLAPQQGRQTMMVELDMLDHVDIGQQLLKYVRDALYKQYPGQMRVHWGLDLDTMNKQQAEETYGKAWYRWLDVYGELNKSGMWNNKFTDNMGISKH